MTTKASTPLAQALEKHGISANSLAVRIGTSRQNVSRWVRGEIDLPVEQARRIAPVLNTTVQWLLLGGTPDELTAVALIDGERHRTHATHENSIPEIDAFAGAGGGGFLQDGIKYLKNRAFTAEQIRAEWIFPEKFVRDELRANFGDIEILGVRGDSMTDPHGKGFRDGDRVLVNRRDRLIRQGGVFAIRDDAEVIIKQVELVRGAEPPRITCTSWNLSYKPFDLILDDSAALIGRVIMHLARV